jgi:hypothetical protein
LAARIRSPWRQNTKIGRNVIEALSNLGSLAFQ